MRDRRTLRQRRNPAASVQATAEAFRLYQTKQLPQTYKVIS